MEIKLIKMTKSSKKKIHKLKIHKLIQNIKERKKRSPSCALLKFSFWVNSSLSWMNWYLSDPVMNAAPGHLVCDVKALQDVECGQQGGSRVGRRRNEHLVAFQRHTSQITVNLSSYILLRYSRLQEVLNSLENWAINGLKKRLSKIQKRHVNPCSSSLVYIYLMTFPLRNKPPETIIMTVPQRNAVLKPLNKWTHSTRLGSQVCALTFFHDAHFTICI